MTTRMRRGTVWLVAAFVVALAVAGTAEARVTGAQASELQRQVDHVLRHSAPGARQIAPNRVTWPRAGVTLTLPVPGTARAAGLADCPKYYACLWQDANYRNRRVQFLHYRTYNLRAYGMPPFTHKGGPRTTTTRPMARRRSCMLTSTSACAATATCTAR